MEDPAEDFIAKFHSLEGSTIAEVRRSFFGLLHQSASFKNTPSLLDTISANLVPKTYLESLFKLDFLIYFRRTQELFQIFKEGNAAFVSKISRQAWFFQEAFNNVQPEELVNVILPTMSYVIRMKVLRKLSKCINSDKFDKIFDAVVARYGIFVATNVITGCSPAKAREVIKAYPMTLTHVELKIMYKKDRNFIEFYFDNSTSGTLNAARYRALVKFLFFQDRELHDYLKHKYKNEINLKQVKLGQRPTKKLVKTQKKDIIENPHSYSSYIHMKAVVRKLGKDAVRLFCNGLPPQIDETRPARSMLQWFHKKYHYKLFIETVQNHYNRKYLESEHHFLIDKFLLNLIPENAERGIFAKAQVDDGNDEFVVYLPTNESIPLIKEKINVTSSIYERGKLVRYLIETCHINKDIGALAQVMKYFVHRHKNDELNVHMQFIQQIENLFGFKDFTEEMWNLLNELLTIHMLKFDQNQSTYEKFQTLPLISFSKGTSCYQKLSYLEFLFNKGEPVDELITEYLSTCSDFPKAKHGKEFQKYFLMHAIKLNSHKADGKERIDSALTLIGHIEDWNHRYKDDQLSFYDYPSLLQAFNYTIRKAENGHTMYIPSTIEEIFKSKIFTHEENPYRNEYLQIYWEDSSEFIYIRDILFFLKYNPHILVQNFEPFVKYIIDNLNTSYKCKAFFLIKKYSHLELDTKTIQFCLSKLRDDECLEKKSQFIVPLSILMKPADFASLADSYRPANRKLDLKNETEVRLYNLQCAIGANFKRTQSHEVLSSLLHYCAGDYFKYSMSSLYSILYHTPEHILPQYLDYLARKAVSVRKHALYLTCELCELSKVEHILEVLNKNEGDASLQKYYFTTTIQYFVKNPSDKFFDMVKRNMLFISDTDDESHQCIVEKLSQVPIKYKSAYMQYCWEFFDGLVTVWKKLSQLKESLLNNVSQIMIQLPLEFLLKILDQHFYAGEKSLAFSTMSKFGFALLTNRSEKAAILERVLDIVEERVDAEKRFEFYQDWYSKTMSLKASNLEYMETFVSRYESKIDIIEKFDDYIRIFFLRVKLEFPGKWPVEDFSSKVFSLVESLTSSYGPYILLPLANAIRKGLSYFTSEEVTGCHYTQYYLDLINRHPTCSVAVLLLNILRQYHRPSKKSREFCDYNRIFKKLKTIQDPFIQIDLHLNFKFAFVEKLE